MRTAPTQRSKRDEGVSRSPDEAEGSSRYFDRVVEVYKARLTLHATLMLAMVTLTGYAYQNDRADLFFLAATIPFLSLAFDLIMKREFACPFLYKAILSEVATGETESIAALFLDFTHGKESKYVKLLASDSEEERRKAFRKAYLGRGLWLKGVIVATGATIEIFLGIAHL